MSAVSQNSFSDQLETINNKIRRIDKNIADLKEQRETLLIAKEKLTEKLIIQENNKKSMIDWSSNSFSWSNDLLRIMKDVFNLTSLRPFQLEAINATMSKEDVLLIMPTGGGKSLCYQLPAFLLPGVTLVVSPLISLIQDQVSNLQKLGVEALMLSATSDNNEKKKAMDLLQNKDCTARLLYVTPERLANSKRFMSQLQKCAAQGRFSRLAIDEVHCCSTWGHDFRTDYNYLGVLKDMFPNTPILGVTATSSSKVTLDVQKMLNLEKALILRAPFNRANLNYAVIRKPDKLTECADIIATWLKTKYLYQSGIIYATTIKECEDLAQQLRSQGIKAGIYHASLEADVRSKIYCKWSEGLLQVVVATIAFGLGIDKPDVRFVIHAALSKSMEMLYQESGRAGRDGQYADCILLYKLPDVFKISTMVFSQKTGLQGLYGIVNYCLDQVTCRRSMLAEYFDEVWDKNDCDKMCDNCRRKESSQQNERKDIAGYCRTLYLIIDQANKMDQRLTSIKLIDAWLNTGNAKLRLQGSKPPPINRQKAEIVVAHLLIYHYLKEDFHYTAYSTISYLRKGTKSGLLDSKGHSILCSLNTLPSSLDNTPKNTISHSSKTTMKSEISTSKRKHSSQQDRKEAPVVIDVDGDDFPEDIESSTSRNTGKRKDFSDGSVFVPKKKKVVKTIASSSGEDESN